MQALCYQGLIHEMPVEEWKEMFDVNVHGLFYCTKMAVPDMIEMQEGHIVNISSIAGTNGVENHGRVMWVLSTLYEELVSRFLRN